MSCRNRAVKEEGRIREYTGIFYRKNLLSLEREIGTLLTGNLISRRGVRKKGGEKKEHAQFSSYVRPPTSSFLYIKLDAGRTTTTSISPTPLSAPSTPLRAGGGGVDIYMGVRGGGKGKRIGRTSRYVLTYVRKFPFSSTFCPIFGA